MLLVILPARNTLPVAKIGVPFFWKSALRSSLLDVLNTRESLITAIADNGTVRWPMV
jgi:hypothetical protein